MSTKEHPSEDEAIEPDAVHSPASESETESRRERSRTSEATEEAGADADDVTVLPGTGGPDDFGDIDVNPGDIDYDEIRRDTSGE